MSGERYHASVLGAELRRADARDRVLGDRRRGRSAGRRRVDRAPGRMTADLAAAIVVGGLAVLAVGAAQLARRRRDRRLGSLVAIDAGSAGDPSVRAVPDIRAAGHPSSCRRRHARPDRAEAPRGTGAGRVPLPRGPGVGVLPPRRGDDRPGRRRSASCGTPTGRYGFPGTPRSRAELLTVVRAVRSRYDGRATPSPGRCRRCSWADICDVRARPAWSAGLTF